MLFQFLSLLLVFGKEQSIMHNKLLVRTQTTLGFFVPTVSVGMHTVFGFKRKLCWLSPVCIYSRGVRPRGRVTLFYAAKTKSPNKRPPWHRLIPALLVFRRVLQKGLPAPLQQTCLHASPLRAVSPENCDARQGAREGGCVLLLVKLF